MTPSQQAKAAGLKNLSQVAELTGQSLQTLTNWQRNKPDLFRIVLSGCAYELNINGELKEWLQNIKALKSITAASE